MYFFNAPYAIYTDTDVLESHKQIKRCVPILLHVTVSLYV